VYDLGSINELIEVDRILKLDNGLTKFDWMWLSVVTLLSTDIYPSELVDDLTVEILELGADVNEDLKDVE